MQEPAVTLQEWQQFEQQALALFQRMPPRERLKMWAFLGEPLLMQAQAIQGFKTLTRLMDFVSKKPAQQGEA